MQNLTLPTPKQYITVAKFGAPYGIRGWIKLHPHVADQDYLLHTHPWYLINQNGLPELIAIVQGKKHGKSLIVQLKAIHTPEDVARYTGKEIAVLRDQLPALAKGEYYWADLIGLTVIHQDGRTLGTVTDLIATGANDVIIVKGDQTIAIPYLRGSVILAIDLTAQTILVDWDLD